MPSYNWNDFWWATGPDHVYSFFWIGVFFLCLLVGAGTIGMELKDDHAKGNTGGIIGSIAYFVAVVVVMVLLVKFC